MTYYIRTVFNVEPVVSIILSLSVVRNIYLEPIIKCKAKPLPLVRQPMINFDSPAWSEVNLFPVQLLRKPLDVLDAQWQQHQKAVTGTPPQGSLLKIS